MPPVTLEDTAKPSVWGRGLPRLSEGQTDSSCQRDCVQAAGPLDFNEICIYLALPLTGTSLKNWRWQVTTGDGFVEGRR
jgi:hypothetical protein